MLKHKLPVLAALLMGASLPALAANDAAGDCSFNATSTAQNLCHDQRVMRDYALGLTSDTFVDTPPVTLEPIPRKNGKGRSQGPLSLLPGGSPQAQGDRAPQTTARRAASEPSAAGQPQAASVSRVARLPRVTDTRDVTARAPRGPDEFNSRVILDNSAKFSAPSAQPEGYQPQAGAKSQRRYVALGDFTTPHEAIEVARKFNLWTPRIQHVYVNGRHFSRVLVGPFADRSIKSVQKHLDQHGFGAAWPLRATADATPDTLIARYPGDG
ncbi:SPOR domain-containing protein [Denitrobaculum tricleocarpae]|uniref:SPOR domain-containing protein n=1 Tax=Denitrobaculum tricleocarpae TaxID=2591009 RepID=A0A545TUD4_9PROT|nr:hypothetical protein [Denitrobaculum tricleocarpae]TQV80822.1 hypothetical protein FKG95_11785 [Denitrobaculum tricleocarpae]